MHVRVVRLGGGPDEDNDDGPPNIMMRLADENNDAGSDERDDGPDGPHVLIRRFVLPLSDEDDAPDRDPDDDPDHQQTPVHVSFRPAHEGPDEPPHLSRLGGLIKAMHDAHKAAHERVRRDYVVAPCLHRDCAVISP